MNQLNNKMDRQVNIINYKYSMSSANEGGSSQNNIILNPQQIEQKFSQCAQQELRCRICYETSKPLVSICACTGSIRYVHEQCILDWIAKKLESSDVLDIPTCQICHQKFSALMKIGRKKICIQLLCEKIRSMRITEIIVLVFHILVSSICFLTLIMGIYATYHSVYQMIGSAQLKQIGKQYDFNINSSYMISEYKSFKGFLFFIFTNIILEIYGILYFISYLKSKKRLIQQSIVQVVEVVLKPRTTKKQ